MNTRKNSMKRKYDNGIDSGYIQSSISCPLPDCPSFNLLKLKEELNHEHSVSATEVSENYITHNYMKPPSGVSFHCYHRCHRGRSIKFAPTNLAYEYDSEKIAITDNRNDNSSSSNDNTNNIYNDSDYDNFHRYIHKSWLSRKELRTIKKRNAIIISLLQGGKFVEGEHSARGLEIMRKDHVAYKRRKDAMSKAYDAVFSEQHRQFSIGICDPVAIANAYKTVTLESQEAACVTGVRDMEESEMSSESFEADEGLLSSSTAVTSRTMKKKHHESCECNNHHFSSKRRRKSLNGGDKSWWSNNFMNWQQCLSIGGEIGETNISQQPTLSVVKAHYMHDHSEDFNNNLELIIKGPLLEWNVRDTVEEFDYDTCVSICSNIEHQIDDCNVIGILD